MLANLRPIPFGMGFLVGPAVVLASGEELTAWLYGCAALGALFIAAGCWRSLTEGSQ